MRRLVAPLLIATALPLAAQISSPLQLELRCWKSPCAFQIGRIDPNRIALQFERAEALSAQHGNL